MWIDDFVFYNLSHEEHNNVAKDNTKDIETTALKPTEDEENDNNLEKTKISEENTDKVCVPYCIFNLSYEKHIHITRDRVLAFAVREDDKGNEVFQKEEITT